MKSIIIFLLIIFQVSVSAQNSTPSKAQSIVARGRSTFQLSYGTGIKMQSFDSLYADSLFFSCKANSSWLTFRTQEAQEITFTIQSLQAPAPDMFGNMEKPYLPFAVYEFSGNQVELDSAILKGEIKPIRAFQNHARAANDQLNGGGLSSFEEDTISVFNVPYTSGYLRSFITKPGMNYFIVVQIECPNKKCTLNIDNRFTICFGKACVPPKLTLRNVKFVQNQAKITGKVKSLDLVAEMLKNDTTLKVNIEAFTDNTLSEIEALKQSKLRAEAVGNYLIACGVSANRIRFAGKGFAKLLTNNSNLKAVNNRVELTFSR